MPRGLRGRGDRSLRDVTLGMAGADDPDEEEDEDDEEYAEEDDAEDETRQA